MGYGRDRCYGTIGPRRRVTLARTARIPQGAKLPIERFIGNNEELLPFDEVEPSNDRES